jgi:hypothetical protein
MRTVRRLLAAVVAAAVVLGSGVTPAAAAGSYGDDDGTVHEVLIEILVSRGITVGCAPGKYCPTAKVTRGQMASFIIRSLRAGGAQLPASAPDAFKDDNGNVHEQNINMIAALGISLGDGVGNFKPLDPITRGEMALFMRRGFKFPQASGNKFADVTGIYVEPANAVANAGVTFGCTIDQTRFCPNDTVQRDQMASFLIRALASRAVGISLASPITLPEIPGLGLPPLPDVPLPPLEDLLGQLPPDVLGPILDNFEDLGVPLPPLPPLPPLDPLGGDPLGGLGLPDPGLPGLPL